MSRAKTVHNTVGSMMLRVILSLLILTPLVSCGRQYDEIKYQRSQEADKSDTVKIAVIWDKRVKDLLLVEGVTLAAEEINRQGGLFGRKLKLQVYYAKDDAHEQMLAKTVANDISFAAVIGHRSSSNAIPASVIYEYHGLLFVSPSSSNNNLTNHGFEYTFRTIPSDRDVSREIAFFMKSLGHRKIAIIDDRGVYGKGVADGVVEAFADLGLQTVVRRHFTAKKTDFKQLSAELLRHDFDAIFVGGILPQAADFIRVARQMGIGQRIYGGASLDSQELVRIAGNAANGTVVPSSFNPELDYPITKAFVSDFKKRYGKAPDTRAALGYDSLKIIFESMKRSKTAEPSVVASHMRFLKDWQGVTGSYTYNLQGDLVGKSSHFKFLNQTEFVYLYDPAKAEPRKQEETSMRIERLAYQPKATTE